MYTVSLLRRTPMTRNSALAPVGLRPAQLNLVVVQSDNFSERLAWFDANRDPLDVTDWVLAGQIRETYSGVLLADFVVDASGLPDNEFDLKLANTVTDDLVEGVYPWDLVRTAGGPSSPRTLLSGVVVVRPRATGAV